MKLFRKRDRKSIQRGFSLAEVTISIGIVSGILLPIIGLLATGTKLATVSQDQEASSRIAGLLTESISAESASGEQVLLLGENAGDITIDSSGSQQTLLAFSDTGEYLRTVADSEYQAGIREEQDIFYLVSLALSPIKPASGAIPRSIPMFDLKIIVQHPAIAAENDRDEQLFTSRVVAP